jgi:uncharacterized lipoprotein YehR (DUF1307 family)
MWHKENQLTNKYSIQIRTIQHVVSNVDGIVESRLTRADMIHEIHTALENLDIDYTKHKFKDLQFGNGAYYTAEIGDYIS